MLKTLLILLIVSLIPLAPLKVLAQDREPLNFSLLFQGGPSVCDGFLGAGNPAPEGGLWLGIRLSDRFDGLWGLDYYTLPSQVIPVAYGTPTNPVTAIMPSDDFSITVNTRWYLVNKMEERYQRFNLAPYLVGGLGMDLVIDPYPRGGNGSFYNLYFDPLFSMNFGAGLDIPLGNAKQWFLYSEFLDHMVIWQNLTQIYSLRLGVKVMLDSAHVDPFRGVL